MKEMRSLGDEGEDANGDPRGRARRWRSGRPCGCSAPPSRHSSILSAHDAPLPAIPDHLRSVALAVGAAAGSGFSDPDLGLHRAEWESGFSTYGQVPVAATVLVRSARASIGVIAYSWLFEVFLYGVYCAFGLVGMLAYTAFFGVWRSWWRCQASREQIGASLEKRFVLLGLTAIAISPVLTPRSRGCCRCLRFIVVVRICSCRRGRATPTRMNALARPSSGLRAVGQPARGVSSMALILVGSYAVEPLLQAVWGQSLTWARIRDRLSICPLVAPGGMQSRRPLVLTPLGITAWRPVTIGRARA